MTTDYAENSASGSEMVAFRAPREKTVRKIGIALFEILLIFGVFVFYGAWPTPDVNEQYYVGKAIHFWNPSALSSDPFLNTPDSHWLFYACFGLGAFLFSQNVLVWVGRVLVWLMTACAWRRLSRALIPVPFVSVFTASAFAFYLESFHLAGEWIIGGIEGKSFAFPFVFWGLALFIEGKFNRAWILLGIGSAFHVLVGGWAVLACLLAWAFDAHRRYGEALASSPRARGGVSESWISRLAGRFRAFGKELARTLPGLVIGGAISLLGVVPALRLDAGATADVIRESRRIYVFERLQHHLVASSLPWTFLTRFAVLTLIVLILVSFGTRLLSAARRERGALRDILGDPDVSNARFRRLEAFVFAALAFACVGATIDWGSRALASVGVLDDPKDAASLLRYYWYRLSDWAIPLGLVFLTSRLGLELSQSIISTAKEEYCAGRGARALTICVGIATGFVAAGGVVYWACRFFFYRLADSIAKASAVGGLVPLPKPTAAVSYIAAVAILAVAGIVAVALIGRKPRRAFDSSSSRLIPPSTSVCLIVWTLVVGVAAPAYRLAYYVDLRGVKAIPRSAPPKESIADGWIDVCRWARDNTPENAVFIVPRGCESFKWHARRAEAGDWKEIPQDAVSIVEWSRKMERFYANPGEPEDSPTRWNQPLNVVFINKGRARVLKESEEDGYQYAIVETPPYTIFSIPEALKRWREFLDSDCVYQNAQFVVLKLHDVPEATPKKTAAK